MMNSKGAKRKAKRSSSEHKKKKRRYSSSDSEIDTSSTSSDSSKQDELNKSYDTINSETPFSDKEKKRQKKKRKDKDKKHKHKRKKMKKKKKEKKLLKKQNKQSKETGIECENKDEISLLEVSNTNELHVGPIIAPNEEPRQKRVMTPMTKEEYERQQSVLRRVLDPETGRHRLIKGDGEVMEECVSYSRHKEINKKATKGDGAAFQRVLGLN